MSVGTADRDDDTTAVYLLYSSVVILPVCLRVTQECTGW